MSKKQNRKDVTLEKLMDSLKRNPEVLICGPSGSDQNHMRVYAHGGVICKLPLTERSEVKLPDRKYVEEHTDDPKDLGAEYDRAIKNAAGKIRFIAEHMSTLIDAAGRRYAGREREKQTVISLKNQDCTPGHTFVFDIETAVSAEEYSQASEGKKQKIPNFDIAALTVPKDVTDEWTLWVIELKCNSSACYNASSGIAAHAVDMSLLENPGLKSQVIDKLRCRLDDLIKHGVFPGELKDNMSRAKGVDMQKAFLFTAGTGLEDSEKAKNICRKKLSEDQLDKFRYLFCEKPEDVDLSKFWEWKDFSKQK